MKRAAASLSKLRWSAQTRLLMAPTFAVVARSGLVPAARALPHRSRPVKHQREAPQGLVDWLVDAFLGDDTSHVPRAF